MEFGVPKRRIESVNKEKYENIAVITVGAYKGKGTGRTITLNKKAIEGLGLNFEDENNFAQVSFSFDKMRNAVSIANTTGLKNVAEVRVAKTSKSVSDKPYFEAIKENFGAKPEDVLELKLTDNNQDFNGFKTFGLSILESTGVTKSVVDEAAAETASIETVAETVSPSLEETVSQPDDFEEQPETTQEGTEEAPLEYIQEQAAEQEAFEQQNPNAGFEQAVEETQSNDSDEQIDNPFASLNM